MNERAADHLRTAPLGKLMFSLALPSVLAQLVNLLYSIVDRVYIGHIPGIGAMALTGLGLCVPLITLVSAFAAFAGSGGAPQAAIQLGKGDREQAGKILSQAILLLLFFSAVLMAVLYLAKRPLLYFFGASDATIGYADDYISLYLVGTVFVLLTMGLNNFILCQGQAGTAMCSVLIGAVANIILDPVLIFLFGMGIRGAALATVISQALSAVWVLRFLLSERSVFPIRAKNFLPDGKVIAAISALGISPFVMQATESLVAIVFTSGLQKYGSDLYVGTYTILQSLLQLFFTPTHGFTYGVQSILSYNYGAKKLCAREALLCVHNAHCFRIYPCVLFAHLPVPFVFRRPFHLGCAFAGSGCGEAARFPFRYEHLRHPDECADRLSRPRTGEGLAVHRLFAQGHFTDSAGADSARLLRRGRHLLLRADLRLSLRHSEPCDLHPKRPRTVPRTGHDGAAAQQRILQRNVRR